MKRTIFFLVFGIIYSSIGVVSSQVNLKNGLIAYYPFNGNANDESGNGYNGNVNGATLTTDRNGIENSAYNFNGTNNNIDLTNTTGIDLFSGFSIVAWVNFSVNNTVGQSVVSSHKNYVASGFNLAASYNKAQINTNNPTYSAVTNETYNDGKWHLFIGMFDGTKLFMNVDGMLKVTLPAQFTVNGLSNIHIGSDSEMSFYNGKIDDVRIYNRVLNDSEILALYGQTTDSVKKDTVINTKIVSDFTWKTSTIEIAGWNTIDFDDSNWIAPTSRSDVPWSPQANGYSKDVAMIWSATSADSYMRKTFIIESNVIDSAKIKFTIDDDVQLYINGTLVKSDNDCVASGFNLDVKQYLTKGKNVIAVKGHDCGGFQWFCSEFNIFTTIPLSSGVNKINKNLISIFPNPTTCNIQIKGIEGKANLSIFTIDGKLLITNQFEDNETISVSTLPKGIYVVKISTKEGVIEKKLVKN